jgi:hypothetical protein
MSPQALSTGQQTPPTQTPSRHSSSQVGPVVDEVPSVTPVSVVEVDSLVDVVDVVVPAVVVVEVPSLSLALPESVVVPVSLPPEVGPVVAVAVPSLSVALAVALPSVQPSLSHAVSSPLHAVARPPIAGTNAT